MAKSRFYDQIKSSLVEREVESVYNKGISLYFADADITHPFACDGFVDTKTSNGKMLKLVIEYKFDEALSNKVARAKILIQVVYYLKRFENDGMVLPNVCMVGDVNECFVMHTNDLLKYLDENVDWSIAPSMAHLHNADLVAKIAEDDAINPFIFHINETFSFKEVADKIKDLADNIQRYVHVTEHNIANIFDYFTKNVIKDTKKISANDLVSVFMGVISDKENYYLHPAKKNTLVTPNGEVSVNEGGFASFFSYFDRNYTPQEKNKFAEISDRLIEDTNRRNKGEFYTPTLFVDYAHKMLAERFGEDWKEKYVVWDNCCGTKNLTRDYRFNELYCSTLENAELEISSRYNKEAVSFKFDFLNDSLDSLPKGLKDALEQDKPIIFLINPPYATANNMQKDGTSKEGVAMTMVNEQMKADKIGACSQNLYAQFLYRIMKIKEQYGLTSCHIGLFSPTLFLTGGSWKGFRTLFLNQFSFDDAVQFKASHFADVADNWGISFSVWSNGETTDKHNFNYNLIDNVDGEIKVVSTKDVYNIDGQKTANDWAKEPIKGGTTKDFPSLSSAIKVTDKSCGQMSVNAFGYAQMKGNNVNENTMGVSMFSTMYTNAHGISITKDNYNRVVSLFSARKLIDKTWVNSKDEYLAPNTENTLYATFEGDSIVFSLFHSASNQSSLRGVEYKGRKWDIKNEFFYMGRDEILNLADTNHMDDTYNDCKSSSERYVYGILKSAKLSAEAQVVLDKARELTIASFKYRKLFHEEHPNYQVTNWDAGWYQVKAVVKEYMPAEYKEFDTLYKALADKMRPMVYELGFLK